MSMKEWAKKEIEIACKREVKGNKTRNVILTNKYKNLNIVINAKEIAEKTRTYIKDVLANEKTNWNPKKKLKMFL